MRGLEIVARAHDDVRGRSPGRCGEGRRVAADAAAGGSTTRAAADVREAAQLVDGERLVVERDVVAVDEGVLRSSPRIRVHGLRREVLALGSLGAFHQQRQSFRMCSCIRVRPRSAAGSGRGPS